MVVDVFAKVISCQRKMGNCTSYFARHLVYLLVYCIFRLRATRRPRSKDNCPSYMVY